MRAGLFLGALLLWLSACIPTMPPPRIETDMTGSMVVVASGFGDDRGCAAVSLFVDAAGFPARYDMAYRRLTVPIVGGRAEAVFEQVPLGYYAVSVLHDLDQDAVMDRNLFGWPQEAHGVSKNAHGFWGPPAFEDARFGFFADGAKVKIRMEYTGSIREQRLKRRQLQGGRPVAGADNSGQ